MSKTLIKICCGEWDNASRDKRELRVCHNLGANIQVMAKGQQRDKARKDHVDDFEVLRYSTRPLGTKIPASINRIISIYTWANYARKLAPDIISGHDISGLFVGWLSTLFCNKPAQLVYDSHEFEIGRSGERSRFEKWYITQLEGFLMKRCAFSMMVNDTIADEVQRIHHLKERPIVVRNAAPLWDRDEKECQRVRSEFCSALNIPASTFLVIYHGGVMRNRGIENMLRAIAQVPESAGVVLGNGEAAYLDELKEIADELGIKDSVLFHPAVPVEILKNYVGAVDCGIITVPNTCMSYYYMLPNKFFENVQSETPIIGSNFPEITRLVEEYDIGLLCDPAKPEEIAACMVKMRDDRKMYARFKKNLKTAKQDLCWENERKVLEEAYKKILC